MLMSHPPYSPDLNPIEKVWAWLKRKVVKESPTSKKELIETIEEAWIDLSLDFINNFISHM